MIAGQAQGDRITNVEESGLSIDESGVAIGMFKDFLGPSSTGSSMINSKSLTKSKGNRSASASGAASKSKARGKKKQQQGASMIASQSLGAAGMSTMGG